MACEIISQKAAPLLISSGRFLSRSRIDLTSPIIQLAYSVQSPIGNKPDIYLANCNWQYLAWAIFILSVSPIRIRKPGVH